MNKSERCLIVNADDFGLSPGVNRGIIEAHVHGIVTSASAMTRWPAADEAAELARAHPRLRIGLHIDLGEWAYRKGKWQTVYRVVSLRDASAIRKEIRRQLQNFRKLFGRDPDHLDSHQHVHREEPVRGIVLEYSRRLGVPLRHFSQVQYFGGFYGQDAAGRPFPRLIGPAALVRMTEKLKPGVTELCCHPGTGDDLPTMYRRERQRELATLCDPRVKRAIRESRARLRSFADFQ